jgi:hypothetical protein
MVDMRLYKVIIILSSIFLLSNCAQGVVSTNSTQGLIKNIPSPLNLNENQMYDPGGYLWSNTQYLNFFLNNEEKKLHQSAVYHALNNTPNNGVSMWYSKTNNSNGMVRVFHSFQTSTGYCRIYQALIEVNDVSRHQTNKACKSGLSDWVFLK